MAKLSAPNLSLRFHGIPSPKKTSSQFQLPAFSGQVPESVTFGGRSSSPAKIGLILLLLGGAAALGTVLRNSPPQQSTQLSAPTASAVDNDALIAQSVFMRPGTSKLVLAVNTPDGKTVRLPLEIEWAYQQTSRAGRLLTMGEYQQEVEKLRMARTEGKGNPAIPLFEEAQNNLRNRFIQPLVEAELARIIAETPVDVLTRNPGETIKKLKASLTGESDQGPVPSLFSERGVSVLSVKPGKISVS